MKILIAGGTGFIGSAVAKKLSQSGNHISILSRRHQDPNCQNLVTGDITKPNSLAEIKWNFDVIIMCVQFPNHPVENPKKGFTYEKVDGEGTENLCRAIAGKNVKRLIYISGAGTGPDKKENWFRAKWRAESAVKKTGIDYVILRPSWVYGPGDRSMTKFIQFTHLPVMPVIGNGKNRVSPVFIDDLAEVISESVTSEKARNKVIDVGGPRVMTMNEIQQAVLNYKNKRRILLHQPIWLMKTIGTVLNATLKNPPLSSSAVDFINMDNASDSKAVEKTFDIKMRPLEIGLKSFK